MTSFCSFFFHSSIDSSVDFNVKEEIGKLKGELITAIHQNTNMCEKVVNLEAQNDKLQANLEQLKEKTGYVPLH